MALTRKVIHNELKKIGLFDFKQTILGFELGQGRDGFVKLVAGGGIAGNSNKWWLKTTGGVVLAGPLVTRTQLRRCFRELLAGYCNKPEERPGWRTYARLNKNKFGEHYIWIQSLEPNHVNS